MSGRTTAEHLYRAVAGLLVMFGAAFILLPGSEAQTGTVVINEVMASNTTAIADGDGDFSDWIELHNTTAAPIDIGGWTISDSAATWPIPAATIIAVDGYLLIWASDKGDPFDPGFPGPVGQLHANFRLTSAGESVTLLNAASALVDTVTYPPLNTDESWGTDGLGGYAVFSLADVTPGQPNGTPPPTPTATPTPPPGPPSIIFNEAMAANTVTIADGAGDFEDWFELHNPTCNAVDLEGWKVADSTAAWPIPAGNVMAPGDVLLLWASDKGDPLDPDYPGPAGQLHTNFQLTSLGETLSLLDPGGFLIAQLAVPALAADEAWGLGPGKIYTTFVGTNITPDGLNPGQIVPDCTTPPTPTAVPTSTPTAVPTSTPTAVPTSTPTAGPTPTPPPTVTPGGPTVTPAPTATASPTPGTPTATPTATPPGPTATPTAIPPGPPATATPTSPPSPPSTSPLPCSVTIVINELMPNNDGVRADGDSDFPDWIELYNPAGSSVDLSDWRLADASNQWSFPAGSAIGAGEYLIVFASDKGDPDDPLFPGPSGEFHTNFQLSSAGEVVVLFDAGGCLIDRVAYPTLDDNESWGVTAQGSIERFLQGMATPGRRNGATNPQPPSECFAPLSPIRINRIVASNDKVLFDGDGDASDFLELRNTGFDAIDLSAWRISDTSSTWVIPAGTVMSGYDTLIIWASDKGFILDEDYPGPPGELHASFRLTGDGERLTVAEPGGCIADRVDYPPLDRDEVYGFDAQGQPVVSKSTTPDDPEPVADTSCSSDVSVVVVALQENNDSRFDEDGDDGDWLELGNLSTTTVDLEGWVLSDGGSLWPIPDGVTIDPGEVLLIWADDKDRGGADSPLHANFRLAREGETVTLESPDGCERDRVTYPELEVDLIWTRGSDGTFSATGQTSQSSDDGGGAAGVTVTGTCVAINELMAKNDSTIADDEGEFGDWIELVNLGEDTVDLSGWTISDEGDGWVIPDGVEIEAGSFLLLWADDGDRGGPGEELHTDFKLGDSGEPVTLLTADGDVAASLSGYPELDDDESFGVDAAGDYVVAAAGDATPGGGPTLSGCDFEAGTGGAAAADDPPAQDDGAGAETDQSDVDEDSLARTGTETSTRTLVAKFLLVSGAVLLVMARISERRADTAASLARRTS